MTTTLVMTQALADDLAARASERLESAGVLLARVVKSPSGNVRVLAREFVPVPDTAYTVRRSNELSIESHGYVDALRRAADTDCIALWVHTHPGGRASTAPSRRDERVDEQLAEVFKLRTGSETYGAIIFGARDRRLTFTGHVEVDDRRHAFDQVWVVGPRLDLILADSASVHEAAGMFDRNVRALGGRVQGTLNRLRVAVVGAGGTGSSVAEQLVRLGVRNITLIDPDALSASNTTRVYGSTPVDVGKPKVEVLASWLRRIAPDAVVVTRVGSITDEKYARQLLDADVIFGCTDDNGGRLVLSRLASYAMVPVIDCGVLISSDAEERIAGIDGRVTILVPGAACLVCRNRIDLARARAEALSEDEHRRLAAEGYAPALAGIEPAVVTFTTQVAATAVAELIERLVRYGPEPAPSEVLLRLHDREVSTNDQMPRPRHYCDPAAGKVGLGETDPFLEQTWRG